MVDEGVTLSSRRVPDLGFHAVLTSDDVEAVGVSKAIKPVGEVKCPVWGIVDFVGPRSGAKQGPRGPDGDFTSDLKLDGSATLIEVGKLLSNPPC